MSGKVKSSRSGGGSKGSKKSEKDLRAEQQTILNGLLQKEENKYCADCNCRDPRWASWNLGVFLCIRCAGIHRNLGVHISRVKSVNLDSWTPEQIQSISSVGNAVARETYEAGLPEVFTRPQTDYAMEVLIRAKYEQKKYMVKVEGSLAASTQISKPLTIPHSQSDQKLSDSATDSTKKSSKHRRKASSGQLDPSPNSKHRSSNKSSSGRAKCSGDPDSKSVDSLLLGLDKHHKGNQELEGATQLLSLDDSSIQDVPHGSSVTSCAQNLSRISSAPATTDLLSLGDPVTSAIGSQPLTFDPIQSSPSTNQITANRQNSLNGDTGITIGIENGADTNFSKNTSLDGKSTLVDDLFGVNETVDVKVKEEMKKNSANNDILSLYNRSNSNSVANIQPNSSVVQKSASNASSHWSTADKGNESSAVIGQTLCHSLWQ